jgi:putative tricarboxylic transport membrane protein
VGALAFMFVFMKVVYLSLPIGRPPFAEVSLALMQLMGIR